MRDVHLGSRSGLIAIFALGVLPAVLAGPQDEEIKYELVRSNPILRQVLSANSPYPESSNEQSIEYKFRESWVDSQIDHFVKQTYLKLTDLKASVQRASSASGDLAAGNSGNRSQVIAELRQALVQAEDQSKNLRDSLGMVLTELRQKEKFPVKVSRDAQAGGFKTEIDLLSEQLGNAERVIRDYFFKPTHVTSVTELKDANMLDYLKRVERIAHAITEKL